MLPALHGPLESPCRKTEIETSKRLQSPPRGGFAEEWADVRFRLRRSAAQCAVACGLACLLLSTQGRRPRPARTQNARHPAVSCAARSRGHLHLALDPLNLPTVRKGGFSFRRTLMAVDAHAVLVELLARLSLPVKDGGGQQFSCRCCVRHGQLESPKGTRLK